MVDDDAAVEFGLWDVGFHDAQGGLLCLFGFNVGF